MNEPEKPRRMPINRRPPLMAYGIVGLLMIVLGAVLGIVQYSADEPEYQGIGGAFSLLDGEGRSVTETVFDGKARAIMFGFTHCPDICPAGLARMRTWQDALGDDKSRVRFAFVSVDPERDTPPVLASYVANFSDDILPLTGAPEQVAAMLKSYGVYAKKVPLNGGGYTMDHHSAVFLFDEDGRFVEFIYMDDSQETALEKLEELAG